MAQNIYTGFHGVEEKVRRYSVSKPDGIVPHVYYSKPGPRIKKIIGMAKEGGIEVENRIFRYHLFSNNQFEFPRYKDGADELYKNLKNKLKNMDKSSIKDWIDYYIDDFLNFFKSFYEILELSLKNPNMFKLLFILRINPYFYAPLVRLKMNNLLDDECLELFGMAEIIFYNFGSTLDATAYHLQDSVDSKENFKNTIIKEVRKKVDMEYHLSEIERYNFDWKKCFHYLFLTYREKNISIDNLMKILGDSKTYSMQIEHIISQNICNKS